jgi:autoinducer 2-degrading protein
MIVRAIRLYVKPSELEAFERITLENHRGSLKEPGVLRFDVLKDPEKPGEYMLYEVFRSPEATEAHRETEHYKRWKRRWVR